MDDIIGGLANLETEAISDGWGADNNASRARRRLEECRAFFERFAAGEPPPENSTYQEWAAELLK